MRPGDTSDSALAIQIAVLRNMSGPDRFRLACELSETVRTFSQARLRQQHPEMSNRELLREFLRCVLPSEEIPQVLR